MRWVRLGILMGAALLACSDDGDNGKKDAAPIYDTKPGHDVHDSQSDHRGTDSDGPLGSCGSHAVFGPTCQSQCKNPCSCQQLITDAISNKFPHVCAKPCDGPSACPPNELCGYLTASAAAISVCLPKGLTVPEGDFVGGSVDCVTDPRLGTKQCRGKDLVEFDKVDLQGKVSGCTLFEVVKQKCASACHAADAGASCTTLDAGP